MSEHPIIVKDSYMKLGNMISLRALLFVVKLVNELSQKLSKKINNQILYQYTKFKKHNWPIFSYFRRMIKVYEIVIKDNVQKTFSLDQKLF